MIEYIITGVTERRRCLCYLCGEDKKYAEEVLERIKNNPNERDLEFMKTHTDFEINEVEEKDQWWNDPFLVN